MGYQISTDCIACGNCSVVCPEAAIDDGYNIKASGNIFSEAGFTGDSAGENSRHSVWQGFWITEACSGCGNCVEVCPAGAIIKVENANELTW